MKKKIPDRPERIAFPAHAADTPEETGFPFAVILIIPSIVLIIWVLSQVFK